MQIAEALERYIVQLEADGRSPHTTAQVRRHVRLLAAWIGNVAVEDLRHEHIAQFLASEVVTKRADGAPRRPTAANALRSSLRTFLSFAHAAGYTPVNAGRLVRRARCAPPQPKALSDSDTAKLLGALEQAKTQAEQRDRVLFHVLLRAGLRVGSAVALQVDDVDLEGGELRLRRMKGNTEDVVFLPGETVALLREHLAERTKGPVFVGRHGRAMGTRQVHRRLVLWTKRAGIARAVGPHALRHAFAMRVYGYTGDLLVTARALCHRSIASTITYARTTPSAVRSAIEAASRR